MKALPNNKKGQQGISAVGSIAIALLIAAVILGLGGTILEKIKTTQTDDTTTVENLTLGWLGNNTPISLNADRVNADSFKLYNNATIVNRGSGANANYTLTESSITIQNISNAASGDNDASWITTDLNASFDYKIGSAARNTSDFGLTGVNTVAEFIPTVAIVAIAAIVIGILLVLFSRRRIPI